MKTDNQLKLQITVNLVVKTACHMQSKHNDIHDA